MRLLSLELEKFGAFADLRIAFRQDARLHVVYGPNEAGKSTALAAVGALLFGVPERTPYASRFPGQLRVGAEIAAADGRRLKFWRRKGRRMTLLDGAGDPLPDDALAPFLGGLSREVFERSFGLDAAKLQSRRRGNVAGGRRRWREPLGGGVRPAGSRRTASLA